ncbi:probable G-protein coupled receptor 158 [Venturia canescens]|uniref:probable G-protein coupled receptor 158 n=1 Tax=Venturia canescens TaxID=32260 RepID=UPI001C9C1F22|nr:probable G-protein coupled receptor 158 [Venturia canescens]
MNVSIIRYAVIVLAISFSSHVTKASRTKSSELEEEDKIASRQHVKSKELLRHQQQFRPHFIDRRLTLDSRIQSYANLNGETESYDEEVSTDSRYIDNLHNLGEEESTEKHSDYKASRRNEEPETSLDKPSTLIRHGRSRAHFARSSKNEESGGSSRTSGATGSDARIVVTTKERDFATSDSRYGLADETTYLNSQPGETTIDNNVTGNVEILDISVVTTNELTAEKSDSKKKNTKNKNLLDDINMEAENSRNRSFDHSIMKQSDSPGRMITSKDVVAPEPISDTSRLMDSFAKLRKVVSVDRNREKSSRDDGASKRYENGSDNRGTSGYGIVVHSFEDDSTGDEIEDRSLFETSTIIDRDSKREDDRYQRVENSSIGKSSDYENETNDYRDLGDFVTEHDSRGKSERTQSVQVDIVTRFLRIIENQHFLGENCTAGTDLNLGEGVVDQYAQERFRLEANLAVNRANMLTRLWKYAPEVMLSSEYLLHASILSMVEFDEDIFAAGNCYDKLQYRDRWLYCPFAHRLQDQDGVLVKDLAVEYKYLSNSSEWFYIARKNAERVIANHNQFSYGYHTYTHNESAHSNRIEDEILTVKYEDGRWSKPYYDCGGGNIWMLTYTVPFFGYVNDTYFFKGTSGIDIDLRRVDIDQCPLPPGSTQLNIFAASDKCKNRTTECVATTGLGFRRGSYRCVCKRGYYYPDTKSIERYYNGTVIEEEYEKQMLGEESQYNQEGVFECLPCAEGCESCEDGSPCVVSLNWLMRTAILILECCIIACLPVVVLFTWKYGNVKVVRAASPVLLRVIVLGAFFIYSTTIVMYPRPNVVSCTIRVWLREIGFSLTYGALMLKTWRISVIFRVKSAKAVKITDMNLLKRLGIIVTIFTVFLGIRTLVAPPVVIVGRTADDLKAYLCRTDWWDHSFTTLEVMFLVWGIRLCIVVRKAPSEFNESRFISMAIYNEFLLSVFLNVSMFFLQSPANPDLLYIIFFCHTQLTVTLLLCLIFGSKAYVVFRGGGKEDAVGKLQGTGKFIGKTCRTQGTSNQTNSISLQQGNFTEEADGVTEEFRRLYAQLELLKEKNMRLGNRHLATKIQAMQEAAGRAETQISTIQAISSSLRLSSEKTSSLIEETEVSTFKEEKSPDIYHQEKDHLEDSTRNKGGKKKSLETTSTTTTKNVMNCKTRPSTQMEENKNNSTKDKTIEDSTVSEISETSEDKEDKELFVSRRMGDKPIHEIALENTLAVVDLCSGKNFKNSTNTENGEASGIIENSTNNKDAMPGTSSSGTSTSKERAKNKSGHARTHAIVINLDDKSRFSEEVTV